MPRLITTREGRTTEYELTGLTTIGRGSQNTIRLPSGKVSRNHAHIREQDGSWVVEDLGSSNGIRVNGNRVSSATLKDGDRIRIGLEEFVYQEVVDDTLLGTRIGNYQILERIGRGGMGAVYRAKQISMERDVALKVLDAKFAGRAGFVEGFMREARLAGKLQHPHLVGIHDFGKEGERYFFSMEFIEGRNLMDDLENKGPLLPERIVTYSTQIAKALSHAHANNILHQDIKPRNILLTRTGEVKVADLGLARVMACGEHEEPHEAMGTPQYVSPEIIRRQPPDVRSDIYSLGATIFHMATGIPPYQGGTAEAIVQQHLNSPVSDPRDFQSDVPDALADFIMRCLQKDPARRPADCDEVLRELESVTAALKKKARKPKPAAVAAAGAAGGAAVGAGAQEPQAAKSAVRQAMSDHTDALPASNPYRPLAIAIFGLGSIFLGAIIAYGIYSLVSGGKASDAEVRLERAQSFIADGRIEDARNELLDLQEFYPDSQEALQAERMLTELDAMSGESPTEQPRDPIDVAVIDPDELASEEPPPPPEEQPAPDVEAAAAEREAQTAWRDEIEPAVDRFLRENEFAKARSRIQAFVENYRDTEAAADAARKLKTVEEQEAATGQRMLAEATDRGGQGDLAGACQAFRNILHKLPDTTWAEQAANSLQEVARQARGRVFGLWRKAQDRLVTLDVNTEAAEARQLANELHGLAWGRAAKDLADELAAVDDYRNRLLGAIRKARGPEVSAVGVGLCELRIGGGGNPVGVVDRDHFELTWGKIAAEDIWDLTPAYLLTKIECIGGALHFYGRGHLGYVRSYLKSVGQTGKTGRLLRQVLAQKSDRMVTEWFDFSEEASQQRWMALDGDWRFGGGALSSMEMDKARIELVDRFFSLGNAAFRFSAKQEQGSGQVALVLAQGPGHFLAVRRSGRRVTLEYASGGAPQRAQGQLQDPEAPLTLTVTGNRGVLSVDGREVANVNAPGCASWNVKLRLELVATSGSFDDVLVAEGP